MTSPGLHILSIYKVKIKVMDDTCSSKEHGGDVGLNHILLADPKQ